MSETNRQILRSMLETTDHSFEGLRLALGVRPKLLEDDLRHIEQSAKHGDWRFVVTPAECQACQYVFRDRKRYVTPGRCPKCRSGRVADAMFRLVSVQE